ncbi:L,D-transpeptidase [Cohnella caldifontis]|uniref:L,D-transpeptidase n=1 Tax=Cohnella caldifontis TaxID=3027471 RepID=UPI0023ED0C91|nr:L,D-transpeptidase family protein [Cohnella sp. YIM B05605]
MSELSGDDRLEQRLKDFYDRVPDVEDALPFKDYLLKHEDSRMAWYLLGKQYESKGQETKAAYCFSQAGEIYEAFENQPAPAPPEQYALRTPPASNSKNRNRWLAAAALLVLLVSGYLIYAGLSAAHDRQTKQAAARTEVATPPTTEPISVDPSLPLPDPSFAEAPDDPPYQVIAGAAEPDAEGSRLLAGIAARAGSQSALMIRTPQLGGWSDWVKSGKPVVSASPGSAAGGVALQWHDAKWCGCTADDGTKALRTVEAWKPAQETKLLLRSAMLQYRKRTGAWPADPESLAGAYPNNAVAGWTEDLTEWFEESKALLVNKKDGKIPQTVGWPIEPSPQAGIVSTAVPSGRLSDLTELPLEIIVDKTQHRLAVVSGNVLLRNYAVGLGGTRTPEGSFYISEKVRDPKGKSPGVFGTRGMTLSDTRYGIHGTNEPDSIGKDESLGCVRMAQEDLEELYDLVPLGTPVTITKGGLPSEIRVPPERFRLPSVQDETNPRKVYDWLG